MTAKNLHSSLAKIKPKQRSSIVAFCERNAGICSNAIFKTPQANIPFLFSYRFASRSKFIFILFSSGLSFLAYF